MSTDSGSFLGYSLRSVETILSKVYARRKQLTNLLSLFGSPSHLAVQSIFIYGHTATGKSLLVDCMLTELKIPHAWINCVECYTQHHLYNAIIDQLIHISDESNEDKCGHCDNMCDFLHQLVNIIKQKLDPLVTTYIVLDRAEVLREMGPTILPIFLRLQEITKMNICVILISEIIWEKFCFNTGSCEPFKLHFTDYTKEELLHILLKDCQSNISQTFYADYIKLILNVFHLATRNLMELQHLAAVHFPKYCEPVKSGEVNEKEVHKLWRHIQPYLKRGIHMVFQREVVTEQWEKMHLEHTGRQDIIYSEDSSSHNGLLPSSSVSRINIELPFYSKFLLLAAYLASYNPAKTDCRFFVKNHRKMKRRKTLNKRSQPNNHLLGPKPFSLDRMLAIFYSIVEDRVPPSVMIFSQVSSLVTLHLLVRTTSCDQLSLTRYKCLVNLEFIRNVGKTVNFDVVQYLNDFAQ